MHYDSRRSLELLRQGTGQPGAHFRKGQQEAIRHLVQGGRRQLLVQRTGWGKSFVYFITTQLLREAGLGPTLLISPLLALMRNQIAAAQRMGVKAETINSDNQDTWNRVERKARMGAVDILLISPERLANERFRDQVLANIAQRVAMLVIDEAHCISDWGHDFRPHYRLIERTVRVLPSNLRLLATTATANARVMADLEVILGPNLEVLRGDLNRPSLALQTISLRGQAERLAWLAERLPSLPGSGIVYTLTVRDADVVSEWLRSRGINVAAYTSETGTQRREELEQALLDNRVKALVATSALGMGFDKPDQAFVIHYQTPGSAVAYYQQVGRAGRALRKARGVQLSGGEDTEITSYFIRSGFPTRYEVEQVLATLEVNEDGLTPREMEARINVSGGRIRKTLELLSLESPAPIVRLGRKWQLTAAPLSDGFWDRAERITALRRKEQAEMQEYVQLSSGHMAFLIRTLNGDPSGIPPPPLPPLPSEFDASLVSKAVAFLQRSSRPLKARRKWPAGKFIAAEHQAQAGRVLSSWKDSGWGQLVSRGKLQDGRFSNRLVTACVVLLREWCPYPSPTWVAAIPSLRNPDLVPDFARRLAAALDLPFSPVLRKTEFRPEQKTMENSEQQARNVLGSLTVVEDAILRGPVLLVDDIVDSRWTFTVAALKLRELGCGPVWPLALANAGGWS